MVEEFPGLGGAVLVQLDAVGGEGGVLPVCEVGSYVPEGVSVAAAGVDEGMVGGSVGVRFVQGEEGCYLVDYPLGGWVKTAFGLTGKSHGLLHGGLEGLGLIVEVLRVWRQCHVSGGLGRGAARYAGQALRSGLEQQGQGGTWGLVRSSTLKWVEQRSQARVRASV